MQMMNLPAAAWACAAIGLLIHAAACFRSLKPAASKIWVLLLPAALALGCAKAGFLLLQEEAEYAHFRWCFSMGLLGLTAGSYTGEQALIAGATMSSDAADTATRDVFEAFELLMESRG